MIIYTDKFIPKKSVAITLGFIILIRPQYKDDIGLLKHEQIHVKQFWKSFCLFPLLYLLSSKYRLDSEVEAYREQLRYSENDMGPIYAKYLSENYHLSISPNEALRRLMINNKQGV